MENDTPLSQHALKFPQSKTVTNLSCMYIHVKYSAFIYGLVLYCLPITRVVIKLFLEFHLYRLSKQTSSVLCLNGKIDFLNKVRNVLVKVDYK